MTRRTGLVVVACIAALLLTLPAIAHSYRAPSSAEVQGIELAVKEANETGFDFSLRDVRVASESTWATAVIHPELPPKQAQDAIGVFRFRGNLWAQVSLGSELCFHQSLARLGMSDTTRRNLGIPKCYEPPPRILVNNNLGEEHYVYKPRRFFVSADGAFGIYRVRWNSNYGARVATAKAVAFANDCDPFCLGGSYSYHRARLRLSKVVTCQGHRTYAQLRYVLRGDVPPNIPRRNTFSLLPRDEFGRVDCGAARLLAAEASSVPQCHTVAQTISDRRGITCRRARQVAERTARATNFGIPECAGEPVRHWNGWTIVGSSSPGSGIATTFSKGRRSFLLSGGGVC